MEMNQIQLLKFLEEGYKKYDSACFSSYISEDCQLEFKTTKHIFIGKQKIVEFYDEKLLNLKEREIEFVSKVVYFAVDKKPVLYMFQNRQASCFVTIEVTNNFISHISISDKTRKKMIDDEGNLFSSYPTTSHSYILEWHLLSNGYRSYEEKYPPKEEKISKFAKIAEEYDCQLLDEKYDNAYLGITSDHRLVYKVSGLMRVFCKNAPLEDRLDSIENGLIVYWEYVERAKRVVVLYPEDLRVISKEDSVLIEGLDFAIVGVSYDDEVVYSYKKIAKKFTKEKADEIVNSIDYSVKSSPLILMDL